MHNYPLRVNDIATLFGITKGSVRNYVREFADYFSSEATPGPGRVREFYESDLKIFTLITELRARNFGYDDIHISLAEDAHLGVEPPRPLDERSLPPEILPVPADFLVQFTARHEAEVQRLIKERDAAHREAKDATEGRHEAEIRAAQAEKELELLLARIEDEKSLEVEKSRWRWPWQRD